MSKLLNLLGRSATNTPKKNNSTATTIAELMERNRRFEHFMRAKVTDLEEKVALDEASAVDLAPIVDDSPSGTAEAQTEPEPITAVEDPFPEPDPPDEPAISDWGDEWELHEDELITPEITPPMTIQPEAPAIPIRLTPATADWQQIPGLLGASDDVDGEELEVDAAEWDTVLPEGKLSDFE